MSSAGRPGQTQALLPVGVGRSFHMPNADDTPPSQYRRQLLCVGVTSKSAVTALISRGMPSGSSARRTSPSAQHPCQWNRLAHLTAPRGQISPMSTTEHRDGSAAPGPETAITGKDGGLFTVYNNLISMFNTSRTAAASHAVSASREARGCDLARLCRARGLEVMRCMLTIASIVRSMARRVRPALVLSTPYPRRTMRIWQVSLW